MEEDKGETGGGRRGGRRDTEAEIGDGPVSQTVSGLLVLHAFSICHCFWTWPWFELMDCYQLIDSLLFLFAQWELRPQKSI